MNKLKHFIIFSAIAIIMIIPLFFSKSLAGNVAPNMIYNADADQICNDIKSGTFAFGIHSYYKNSDTILAPTSGKCSNTEYFNNNLANKTPGQDYEPYTNFTRSSSTAKQYIEGMDVTSSKYRYIYIYNREQAYTNNKLTQSSTMKPGEYLFFDIDLSNKSLKVSNLSDLRLNFNYLIPAASSASMVTDTNETNTNNIAVRNSITYYVYDTNNNKYGPYYLDDMKVTNKIDYKSSSSNSHLYQHTVVSDNLLTNIPSNKTISKIRVVPYEKYNTLESLFRLLSVSIVDYAGTTYTNNVITLSVDNAALKTRQNITNNMATNATLKWAVADGKNLDFYCALCKGTSMKYNSGVVYYGQPYVNTTDSTSSSFLSNTVKKNGISYYPFATTYIKDTIATNGATITKGTKTSDPLYIAETGSGTNDPTRLTYTNVNPYVSNASYFFGMDCSASTFYSVGKEIPYVVSMALSYAYLYNSQTKMLGDLKIENFEKTLRDRGIIDQTQTFSASLYDAYYTAYIKQTYTDQQVYNGYGLLLPGDLVEKYGHSRLETGYPHVECNDGTTTNKYTNNFCASHGGINPTKSYIIITEVGGAHKNRGTSTVDTSTHVSQANAGWTLTPDSRYTDVTNVDDLYASNNTKLSSFRINKKYTFKQLYDSGAPSFDDDPPETMNHNGMYLPFRYVEFENNLDNNRVVVPTANVYLDKEYEATSKNALLYSYLRNDHKLRGLIITNYIIEGVRIDINGTKYYIYPNQTNRFSLYDDIKDETILNKLASLNYNNSNTIKVSVEFGPNISEVKTASGVDSDGYIEILSISNTSITDSISVLTSKLDDNVKNISVDSTNKYINANIGYNYGLNYGDFLDKLLIQSQSVTVKNSSGTTLTNVGSKLGTGSKVILKNNQYDVIVYGDLNGDGVINSADLLKVRQHLLRTITLSGVNFNASDINNDGIINSGDLLRIRQYLLGTNPI